MQWKLCRLAHGTNEQANANHRDEHPAGTGKTQRSQRRSFGKRLGVIEGARIGSDEANAQNKAKVANPVDQKGFHVGKNGGRFIEPKSNQQIRHQANGFPAKE